MTTTTAPDRVGTLTADDLAALRHADDVVFHVVKGESYVFVTIDGPASGTAGVYTAREQRLFPNTRDVLIGGRGRRIDTAASVVGYGDDSDGRRWSLSTFPGATCSALLSAPTVNKTWRTVVGLLRTGDRIVPEWLADNNSENVRRAGMHTDELTLRVQRGDREDMYFPLMHRVGPDDSARMIQRG